MGERGREILFETKHHASGGGRGSSSSFSALSSQSEQITSGAKGGLLSLLSVRGVYQLKDKWNEYRRPRTLKKSRSLFVSPNGEHVAVISENQITVLQEEDNYMKPCGVFTSNDRLTIFKCGAWLEPVGILGVIDDLDTLYIIKSNGEEISRTTSRQLRLSLPISGLIVLEDLNAEQFFLKSFCIVTEDGSLHRIEVTQEPNACIHSSCSSSSQLSLNGRSPQTVTCMDFYQDLSLMVAVGCAAGESKNYSVNSGFYSICLWHITKNFELQLLFCSPNFEGIYSTPKGNLAPSTNPKVLISPQGKYVAALDMNGCLDIYSLSRQPFSLAIVSFEKRNCSEISNDSELGARKCLKDIFDFTWWSDNTLILATWNDAITMLDVDSGMKPLGKDPVYCKPLLERVKSCQGHVFALEWTSSKEISALSEHKKTSEMQDVSHDAHKDYGTPDISRFSWSLMSFSERSVMEMYALLIQKQQYQAALDFADRFQLNRDEIFKAQWLHSGQGAVEINMFLSKIKDEDFVLLECIDKVGPTEDTVAALLSYGLHITDKYKFSGLQEDKSSLVWKYCMGRLQLLQCRDRLETFLGINMGRFSVQEYSRFRVLPINESAVALAESGKIGALNLLFKRHPYSLTCNTLDILAAIPETVPVQSYGQLLPGRSPPSTIILRNEDWVECEQMVSFINEVSSSSENTHSSIDTRTEIILKKSLGLVWPSVAELMDWYKNRARDVDNLSGQLDNCLSLVDFACRKGIVELQQFLEDITYLHQLVYSNEEEGTFFMSLVSWEQLPDYEKFKMMLKGVKEDKVVARLREKAIPFMHKRAFSGKDLKHPVGGAQIQVDSGNTESFLVTWLKEISAENQMDICLAVIEGCKDIHVGSMFRDEVEAVETTLDCLYLCTLTDCWNTMTSILSKLPRKTKKETLFMPGNDLSPSYGIRGFGSPRSFYWKNQTGSAEMQIDAKYQTGRGDLLAENHVENVNETNIGLADYLEKKVKIVEGHVEVGRLLAYYQVPKPMSFFQEAYSDEKNVKQLLRLVLSKFSRRQPGKSDNDWANMWRDILCFQEKAFPFLDKEYMLVEFCRGLLKAGKFSLARNYLKGTGNITLTTEKSESLVIQAAREYFFSASSLACSEIWKAKECLNLFPNSDSVKAESDIIDALTTKLPNLGVTLLPVQFRQIRNPMEIINMVITSQSGAYLDVDELIEIAKLLGLKSQDDIAAIQEAVAREAAVAGDLQLAFDLCLVLAKKGHGPIWDLASAIARGLAIDNVDIISRRQLLGFALSHCDSESIGDLLHAWKDIDMQIHNEKLMVLTGTSPNFSQNLHDIDGPGSSVEGTVYADGDRDEKLNLKNIKSMLCTVVNDLPPENEADWDHSLRETGRVSSFATLQLPWLLELSSKMEYGKKARGAKIPSERWCMSVRMQAGLCILSWLAANDFAPSDDLIASLAKSVMEPPVTEEEGVMGCSFLLNLVDALSGVGIIEEQMTAGQGYQEIYNIMYLGMMYSSLQNSAIECSSPTERRMLLLHRFREDHASFSTEGMDKMDEVQSTFWREWKSRLEEQKRLADCVQELECTIPGVETSRFLSGDVNYIEDAILTFVDSVRLEKKHIVNEAVKVADTYGLDRKKVLLRFLGSALVSEHWTNDEILAEISDFKEDVVTSAREVISLICSVVYPEIEGHNKIRLSYIYSILSACYLRLKRTEEPTLMVQQEPDHVHSLELVHFYKVLEQECRRVSFIECLNFKNIASLHDLNFTCFNEEVCNHVCESTVEALADLVKILTGIYKGSQNKGLISWQSVYKHHILGMLTNLETESKARLQLKNCDNFLAFIDELGKNYETRRGYIRALSEEDMIYLYGKYYTLCVPHTHPVELPDESAGKTCLLAVLSFWIKLTDDIQETVSDEMLERASSSFNAGSLSKCFQVFRKLVMENEISAVHGWSTISIYVRLGRANSLSADNLLFCKAMVFSGCRFKGISEVFFEVKSPSSSLDISQDLSQLYVNAADSSLNNIVSGCSDRGNLHKLLSSVSKLECDNLDDLKVVRHGIWERLGAFSDNMQLPSQIRVYALELMQSVTVRNTRSFSGEHLSDIEPWEGWDDPSSFIGSTVEEVDVPSRLTSTIVALKSTELAAAISPSSKITSEDLGTVDSAISCFLHLSEDAICIRHVERLQAILEEWEELFANQADEEISSELTEEKNNWSSDEWGEGWEDLPDESPKKEVKMEQPVSVHALHTCWMEIIKKLAELSQLAAVIELMDRSLSKSKFVLLSENEAEELLQLLVLVDCFVGLKLMLLLPYKALWFRSLTILEDKLKHEKLCNKAAEEHELLLLILSSGVLPSIATDPAYCNVFSYLCCLVGHLSRLCQEDLLKYRGDRNSSNRTASFLFCRLLLPCFVAELVIAGQHLLAGYIVSKLMHTHASFSLITVVEVSLRKYLEGLYQRQQSGKSDISEMASYGSLVHTFSKLRKKLVNLLQSSLSAIQYDVK